MVCKCSSLPQLPPGKVARLDQAQTYFQSKFQQTKDEEENKKKPKSKSKVAKKARKDVLAEEDDFSLGGTFIFADVTSSPIKKPNEFIASDDIIIRQRRKKSPDDSDDEEEDEEDAPEEEDDEDADWEDVEDVGRGNKGSGRVSTGEKPGTSGVRLPPRVSTGEKPGTSGVR